MISSPTSSKSQIPLSSSSISYSMTTTSWSLLEEHFTIVKVENMQAETVWSCLSCLLEKGKEWQEEKCWYILQISWNFSMIFFNKILKPSSEINIMDRKTEESNDKFLKSRNSIEKYRKYHYWNSYHYNNIKLSQARRLYFTC